MPIKFDEKGNPYPYDVVEINIQKFEQIFSNIPNIERRTLLFQKLGKYLHDFSTSIIPTNWIQWFGGSYTSTKEFPNDIDLVNFIDARTAEAAMNSIWTFITNNKVSADSKKEYSVDGYLIPIFSKTDPRYKITMDKYNYWKKWFGHDRSANPKAIVEVTQK